MALKDEVKAMQEMNAKLEAEDKEFSKQLAAKEAEFDKANDLSKDGFDTMYREVSKNFQLEFGVVCDRGRKELIEDLKEGKDKKAAAEKYLMCVETARQKAANRARLAE